MSTTRSIPPRAGPVLLPAFAVILFGLTLAALLRQAFSPVPTALPATRVCASLLLAILGTSALVAHGRRRSDVASRALLAPPPPPTPAPLAGDVTVTGTDELTGLLSRKLLERLLDELLNAGTPAGLLLIDTDHFRTLRAANGFAFADEVLRETAAALRRLAPPRATVARIYADEFAIVLPFADERLLTALAADLRQALARTDISAGTGGVTHSIGAAIAPQHGVDARALFYAADLALEQAKSTGGNNWRMFDQDMAEAAKTRAELCADLRPGLKNGEFLPYYQPIVDLVSGAVTGFEVLARWQHPRRGLLLPDSFIALVEEQRLCGELSMALMIQVSADARLWPEHWHFAFNASPGQLRELADIMARATRAPAGLLAAERIELEVTENVLIEDMDLARQITAGMHAAGARVVLDDFGTGYANFVHLREIPFDRLKIDKSFVQGMLSDPRTEACVRAMLALARSLGVSVIAEGVETAEAAAHLRAMGCQYAQGYFYAQPLPARDVHRFSYLSATIRDAGQAA